MTRLEKILLFATLTLWASFAIFSYAYVDLNLTISQNPLALKLVSLMQQLGYYNRPQATFIYIILIIIAFSLFTVNLYLAYKSKVSIKYLKISTLLSTLVLIFAYPFLSSDLFNYMFDAKIITHYHQSPYANRPLDFPNDEWLRFMRWVHRYSPYGPAWLFLSLIPSVLGFGKFILTLLTFKIFIGAFHLVNSYLIYKILFKLNPKVQTIGTAFYAMNPLFLIEGVANAHNDIVLASFLIATVYFITNGKKMHSIFSILLGTFVKYIQILTLPWYLLHTYLKKITISQFILLNIATMVVFTYIFSSFRITVPFVSSGATQVQFQPWYLFWTLPLVALIPRPSLLILATAASIGASLRYLPYLYNGDWSHPNTTEFATAALIIPILLSLPIVLKLTKSSK